MLLEILTVKKRSLSEFQTAVFFNASETVKHFYQSNLLPLGVMEPKDIAIPAQKVTGSKRGLSGFSSKTFGCYLSQADKKNLSPYAYYNNLRK